MFCMCHPVYSTLGGILSLARYILLFNLLTYLMSQLVTYQLFSYLQDGI